MSDWFITIFKYKDKKSPDKLGKFPTDVHIPSFPERRYLWTSRVLVGIGVFSLCSTTMLASAIYVLLPQRRAVPQLYEHLEHSSSLSLVPQEEISISPETLVIENIIRRYIFLRHDFPKSYHKLLSRWQKDTEFYQLSNSPTYNYFAQKMNMNKLQQMYTMKFVRKVEVEWVKQITNNLWQAQFVTFTTTKDYPEPIKAIWRAHIKIGKIELKDDADIESYIYNPMGFKILNYSVGYAGNGSENESYLDRAKAEAEKK